MEVPPYARIAADIKRRVADGRLRPGDRVPSTRQLARDWNVALATATRALALLAQEGVVIAEPRVGTVVAEPLRSGRAAQGPAARRGAPAGPDGTRERVVRAAVEIADADGLDELTMRGLADRLGMATMSLYRHVGGKDELVLLMLDTVIGDHPLPAEPPAGWREALETTARLQWAAYRAHPWMADVSSLYRPLPSAGLLKHSEWAMRALAGTRLDATAKMHVHILVHSFVQGLAANIEQERRARAATGLSDEEWMSAQEERMRQVSESPGYGAFAAFLRELGDFDLDLDRLFEFGLRPLLDGLSRMID
ncbi:TetR/AcrR family transcriptional regulator C-terminal domain-containing protein [Actinomadura sp. ATCC 31491]|uniref:TetR/AcrR family transcriptional regulator C-terminal domain-containing protein n=1 Tax=Actinomadura luzonensis TaxID=2805427 RepID=A0ABT0FRR6_9ACTN|nr:TetR/AcrR family transcriptional regulator C-terminal domain-containing protein [Actinomadura luzonensis]MCK2214964.1 TetR/AcrR family transcriptional regulator C-terminal domain-containing protein [Actinomadura luzonensis]